MTEPAARLAFTLTSTPNVLVPATAGQPRQGRLEISAALADADAGTQPLRCRSITVTVPTGIGGQSLTDQADRIDTAYRAARSWHVFKNTADPRAAVFVLRPSNPRHEAVFDAGVAVSLILDRIPLTGRPGTLDIQVTSDIGGEARAFAETTTTLRLRIADVPD